MYLGVIMKKKTPTWMVYGSLGIITFSLAIWSYIGIQYIKDIPFRRQEKKEYIEMKPGIFTKYSNRLENPTNYDAYRYDHWFERFDDKGILTDAEKEAVKYLTNQGRIQKKEGEIEETVQIVEKCFQVGYGFARMRHENIADLKKNKRLVDVLNREARKLVGNQTNFSDDLGDMYTNPKEGRWFFNVKEDNVGAAKQYLRDMQKEI